MTPVQVVERLRSAGATLHVSGGDLSVDAPRGAITPDMVDTLREHKAAVVELLQSWDEAEAYRLFKAALEATNEAYMHSRPAWCHPLFDAINAAWDRYDMAAVRTLTHRAMVLAAKTLGKPAPTAPQPKSQPKRYGTQRDDIPRCHGCGAEVLHWYITECFHCRIGKSTKTGGVSNGDGS